MQSIHLVTMIGLLFLIWPCEASRSCLPTTYSKFHTIHTSLPTCLLHFWHLLTSFDIFWHLLTSFCRLSKPQCRIGDDVRFPGHGWLHISPQESGSEPDLVVSSRKHSQTQTQKQLTSAVNFRVMWNGSRTESEWSAKNWTRTHLS